VRQGRVIGTQLTVDGLTHRLMEYRAVSTDDDIVQNYFDELEDHPQHIGLSHSHLQLSIWSVFDSFEPPHMHGIDTAYCYSGVVSLCVFVSVCWSCL